jgi:hypothetical protein
VVQARRAKVRPVRVIIPLVVAAALLVGGSFAAVKFWPTATTAGPEAEASSATQSQAPTTAESSPSPSATASSTTEPVNAAAAKALEACQKKVAAADEVINQAETGVGHWAQHIQSQKDFDADKISETQKKARFKKSKLKGPADQKRYTDALSEYRDLKGSCDKVKGADAAVAATLAKCKERSKAQKPVLAAGAAGMKDWRAHLSLMARNALHQAGTPSQALATWLKQYSAAPKNIKAFKKATKNYKAPSC